MKSKTKSFLAERKRNKDKLRFGYQSTYMGMLGVIFCLLIYYVVSINTNATLGYDIRDLENVQKELKIELERLDVKIAELESSESVGSDPELKKLMEEYADPNYLVIKENVQYVYNN